MAVARGEGYLAPTGALVARTDPFTGRTPKDKFTVREPGTEDDIWWGEINQPFEPDKFERLLAKVRAYLQQRDLFVFDGWVGADVNHRMGVRIVTEKAWHSLFARTLFIRPTYEELKTHKPQFTVINACEMYAEPEEDGTRTPTFIVVSFERRLAIIGGTHYAGEMKKSIFGILNYLLPQKGICPMHCSANMADDGSTALFFGLSGTGKTTLSADPDRRLIGDDEHGWTDDGIFNFEGGCYAKTIRLTREGEPQIWDAIRFGSVLENVIVDPHTREVDYDDATITENTRATYPVEHIDNCVIPGVGGHPKDVIFLTCDAFGVLPPISKLTIDQAVYYFLSGYTAKVAGTEAGLTEPQATFSTCFGAPFLALHPTRYAQMLRDKVTQHGSSVWLVNTGWIGGAAGTVPRMKLAHTRAMLTAALGRKLDDVGYAPDPVFGVLVPETCPDVPAKILKPANAWKDEKTYRAKARELAKRFEENFRNYADQATDAVKAAGPKPA
ncbi:MAG: phosphoenolpyruvate carboxykinase (ATP), partial [Nitrospinota bacterium]